MGKNGWYKYLFLRSKDCSSPIRVSHDTFLIRTRRRNSESNKIVAFLLRIKHNFPILNPFFGNIYKPLRAVELYSWWKFDLFIVLDQSEVFPSGASQSGASYKPRFSINLQSGTKISWTHMHLWIMLTNISFETQQHCAEGGIRGEIHKVFQQFFSQLEVQNLHNFVSFVLKQYFSLSIGADINFGDKYGQTCMHEISRDWHTDVAQFALSRGADINKSDHYGRTPLHLAAAVNYAEMVFWLLSNGGRYCSFAEMLMGLKYPFPQIRPSLNPPLFCHF